MIATIIKHYLYDTGLNLFFDQVSCNFHKATSTYLGNYWTALDKDDGTIVVWGLCIEETVDYVVLESEFSEIMVPLENYVLVIATERQINLLDGDNMSDEDLIVALNEENRIYWKE